MKSLTAKISYRAVQHSVQMCRLCPLSIQQCAAAVCTLQLSLHLSRLLNSTVKNKHNITDFHIQTKNFWKNHGGAKSSVAAKSHEIY